MHSQSKLLSLISVRENIRYVPTTALLLWIAGESTTFRTEQFVLNRIDPEDTREAMLSSSRLQQVARYLAILADGDGDVQLRSWEVGKVPPRDTLRRGAATLER